MSVLGAPWPIAVAGLLSLAIMACQSPERTLDPETCRAVSASSLARSRSRVTLAVCVNSATLRTDTVANIAAPTRVSQRRRA